MSVRQFTRIKDLTGICVRFPDDEIEAFKAAQKVLKISTLNKLLSGLATDGLSLALHDTFDLPPTKLMEAARLAPTAMKKFRAILKLGHRTVPNNKSYTKWVSIPDSVSEALATIAKQLQWSEGQVVQQAIRSTLTLICAESPGEYPELFKLVRGYRELEARSKEWVLKKAEIQTEIETGQKRKRSELLSQKVSSPDSQEMTITPPLFGAT